MLRFENKKYYPALDGLRAYSAIAVILFHADMPCIGPGWLGVNFFFVLSGFLITSILLQSKEAVNYFSVFYSRRFLRIFPVYYLLLFTAIILAIILGRNIKDAWYYLFYIQNFKLALNNWHISFPLWLGNTWTLAIEEQFYIFFPFLVKYLSKKALVICCFMLILISIINRYVFYKYIGWGNTLSNLDYLSAGALLSIFLRNGIKPDLIFRYLCISFSAMTLIFFFISKNFYLSFLVTCLLPFITIVILILVTYKHKLLAYLFENRLVLYIGKISYGIYLYHIPFFMLINRNSKSWPISLIIIVKIAGTIIIAALSFRFFESRFIKMKNKFILKY
ncbi:MAG TPA: acyltransferase [Bacteroidia bacterium]|jgi:peptidoglycan/LPS O-acetylase OafA/YrhL|nr:acyltransferase [Bacteroidia bacterium]